MSKSLSNKLSCVPKNTQTIDLDRRIDLIAEFLLDRIVEKIQADRSLNIIKKEIIVNV